MASTKSRFSRGKFLGIAAAILVIASITVTVANRRPEPAAIDTSRDAAIAELALLTPAMVDYRWNGSQHRYDNITSRVAADAAATVPECAPYLDDAFDSPRRQAAAAGTIFDGPTFQWVYVFPTEDAATRAMDKISEPSFVKCFEGYYEALALVIVPPFSITVTTVEAPTVAQHGDRQVVFGTFSKGRPGTGIDWFPVEHTNVFVQVGRGIVCVDPHPDFHNSLDPHSAVETFVAAAAKALTDALAAGPTG